MASITLRSGATGATGVKNAPLTNAEIDTNFSNINADIQTRVLSTDYEDLDVLNKIKNVDGSGSGLDADLLDGLNAVSGATGASIVSRDASGNFSANTVGLTQLNTGNLYLGAAGTIVFEGTTDNTSETTLTVVDPTADRTITLPNVTGTVITTGDTGTVTNTMLAGSIANDKLTNSSINIDGNAVSLGGSVSITGADLTWTGTQTFRDDKLLVVDNVDNTKRLALQISNISTGTTRTLTVPDVSGTIAIGQQVLTNSNVTFANSQITSLGVGTTASGSTGEIRATGNIIAFSTSDKNLKENIAVIPNALQKVEKLRGVTFDWIDEEIVKRGGEDGYFIRKNDIGVIAQEVEAVLPEIVATNSDGYKAVKYELIVPLLIEAIKELSDKYESLKGQSK